MRNWLSRELVKAGHHVVYASPKLDDDYYSAIDKSGLKDVVDVLEYPFHLKKRRPVRYWKAISNLFKEKKIDLLIIFGGSLVEQVIARLLGIKILLSERCDPASRPFLSRVLKQIQYRVADGYVFQTPEASHCYGRRAHKLSIVIPNPIIDILPEPQFDNLRKEIVTVGRLSPEKNQKVLIEAFELLHRSYPDYKLIIYGSGPLQDTLASQIDLLRLNDVVDIIGGRTNISELIKGAELFVLPSNTEGMPNALIEAMSMGLLCISTDCPIYGPRLLVEDGINAFLVPVGDVDALSERMIQAIKFREQFNQVRKKAIEIRSRLAPEKIANRWLAYIDTITA